MALSPIKLVQLGIASYTIANDAELSVYAGCAAAAFAMTVWNTNPVKTADAKAALAQMATDNGIPLTDWQDKVGALFKFVAKFQKKAPNDPALIAVRDANDELTALQSMRDLFTIKGLTCRHYFKVWSNDEDLMDPYNPETVKAAKAEEKRRKLAAMLNTASNIDAVSEAVARTKAREEGEAAAKEAAKTPLDRFIDAVSGINDMAELDAMFAVLNARSEVLRGVAEAHTAQPAPGAVPVSKAQRAKARREAVAA